VQRVEIEYPNKDVKLENGVKLVTIQQIKQKLKNKLSEMSHPTRPTEHERRKIYKELIEEVEDL